MPDDFSHMLAETARKFEAQPDMQRTLQSVVDLAAEHLRGRGEVGVSMITRKREVETPAASSDRAFRADALQYELDEGPCLDATWEHETFQVEDLPHDQHYPRWSPRVVAETGLQGVVSYQLFTDTTTLGALNLYTDHPRPYEAVDRAEGLLFATHAAVALQAARTEQQLNSGLLTRNMIGQAQGILMERFGLSAVRAFDFLARLSQDTNTKLSVVAQRVIETPA